METQLDCRGCGKGLPDHHAAFVDNREYNLWAREGYCSFFCFRDNAPPELLAQDDEIDGNRQRWLSAVDAAPRRVESPRSLEQVIPASVGVESPRSLEQVIPASVGLRVFARILDSVVSVSLVVGLASILRALIDGGVLHLSPEGSEWLLGTALLSGPRHWEPWLAHVLGSVVFFTVCQGISGTTPVKFISNIAVVTEDQRYCGPLRSLIREVLYIFDVIPLISLACMSIGESRQRLGDFAARTVAAKFRPGQRTVRRSLLLGLSFLIGLAGWVAVCLLIRVGE